MNSQVMIPHSLQLAGRCLERWLHGQFSFLQPLHTHMVGTASRHVRMHAGDCRSITHASSIFSPLGPEGASTPPCMQRTRGAHGFTLMPTCPQLCLMATSALPDRNQGAA